MLMCRCIIRMNVNNSLISLAIFRSNLPQSKYETGLSIGYPIRKLTNSRVCVFVCVSNTELYINLSSTQTSLQQKTQYRCHLKETPLCQQYTESGLPANRCRIWQWQIHWLQSKPIAYLLAWSNNYFSTESHFPLRTSTNDTVTNEQLKIKCSLM
jgi:hypothetical protein